jgi:hypothetical protein
MRDRHRLRMSSDGQRATAVRSPGRAHALPVALTEPIGEPFRPERDRQERGDHARADEHIEENDDCAAVDHHEAWSGISRIKAATPFAAGESNQYLCRFRLPICALGSLVASLGSSQLRWFATWEAVEVVGLVWTAMILAYAVIAVALMIGRRALNRIRQALEHEGPLPHPAQDQPGVVLIDPTDPRFSNVLESEEC